MEIEAETRRSPSLDAEEVRRFERLAKEWWDERGKFRALHAINPARLAFIVQEVQRWRSGTVQVFRPLEGLSVIDIGCGGGILSEPLARLGAGVTGIDPVEESIGVAKAHAQALGLAIAYRSATAEDIVREGQVFDAVIASEVVEHVADVDSFLRTCRALCKPGGLLILSTLNRTAKSYGLAIVAAERVLGLVPPGTHDWKKFIKPEELEASLSAAGFKRLSLSGIVFHPFTGAWGLSATDTSVNYMVSAEAV
ncbi:MAG: bifunctional 2-polyprenyl-6-hydroxyphenol methylase/3-demethylubiquinol 3-O-methyltransferase UbiG [Rhodomicrobium sp.]